MTSSTFGVGVVGAGRIFEQHARACVELGGRARLLAIADVDEAQLRAATGRHFIPFSHLDYRALLDCRDIDVVAVCTPPALHERIVVDALEAGKFVMCEKPIAHTLAAADAILAAARRHPGRLSTVFQFRYLPEVCRLRWLSDQGTPRPAGVRPLQSIRPLRDAGQARETGKGIEAGQGARGLVGPLGRGGRWRGHDAVNPRSRFSCAICWEDRFEVTAVMDTLKEPIESEDTCAATVRFENGAMACCYGTMTAHRTASAFDVIGESASAHLPWALECPDRKRREQLLREVDSLYPLVPGPNPKGGIVAALGARLWPLRTAPTSTTSAHTPYVADVLDAIEAGRPLPVGPEEARTSLDLCTAVYASALTGLPIAVPLDSQSPFYTGLTTAHYDGRRPRRSDPGVTAGEHAARQGIGR